MSQKSFKRLMLGGLFVCVFVCVVFLGVLFWFSLGLVRVLYLERSNPMHQSRLGAALLDSIPVEKDLGAPAVLDRPCALGPRWSMLGCVRKGIVSGLGRGSCPSVQPW